MSGGFWAGSIPQWGYLEGGFVAALFLLVGMMLGRGQGQRRAEAEAAERRALRAQARWLKQLADPETAQRREAVARRVHPVFRGSRGGTVMPHKSVPEHGPFFMDGLPLSSAGYIGPDQVPEVAHEWEPAHVGAALALANSDPITTGEIEAIGPSMDRWLAEHVYGVPYSADELWSGQ